MPERPGGVDVREVPWPVRLRLGHAAIQRVADGVGVDVLHIKGLTVARELRPSGTRGSDVDIIVRPSHVERLDRAMRASGWVLYSTFRSGSPFGHAQTYSHESWGYIDLHRFFPGLEASPARSFERLWSDREFIELGGWSCAVPDLTGQALILVLNDARAAGGSRSDTAVSWKNANAMRRNEIMKLVKELDAEVAFAAATGGLEQYRDRREYQIWKIASEGGSRTAEWRARVRAAPSFGAAVRLTARAPLVNVDRLTHRLGRRPTRPEVAAEFVRRIRRGVGETLRRRRR
ncbi:nucleotidyltransferase family protein [Agromyces sp. SYSU T00194]|uniref:nucleotidyltransferase family protein n=1 Tax=Agromyces chitinivorans TaxID=3158560 RepID=UPI00339394A0